MIIGNNNNNILGKDHFTDRFTQINDEAKKRHTVNTFNPKDILKQSDVTNRNEMADKSLAMLQERLNNGLISLDEFNQKAKKINQFRQNR